MNTPSHALERTGPCITAPASTGLSARHAGAGPHSAVAEFGVVTRNNSDTCLMSGYLTQAFGGRKGVNQGSAEESEERVSRERRLLNADVTGAAP